MKRTIRAAVAAAAHAGRGAGNRRCREITVAVDLPAAVTAAAPVWIPSGYTEVATASRWARPAGRGLCHAIVTTYSRENTEEAVLASGTVTAGQLLGLGGLCDKPHRIRWMAVPGTLAERPLDGPAAAYQEWAAAAEKQARLILHDGREHGGAYDPLQELSLEHCPNGAWRAVISAELDGEPGWLREDVDRTAAAVTALARHYGPGTRVRAYPWGRLVHRWQITEPAYAAALCAFRVPASGPER